MDRLKEHKLQTFTIYYDPTDYPGKYVCRQFHLDKPTANHFVHDDYDMVIHWMHEQFKKLNQGYPYRMPRLDNDDPKILEVWM